MKKIMIVLIFLFLNISFSIDFIEFDENYDEKSVTKVYELNHTDSTLMIKALKELVDGKVTVFKNKLIVKTKKSKINDIDKLIKDLDKLNNQVLIKLSILDTTHNFFKRVGIYIDLKKEASILSHIKRNRIKFSKYRKNGDIKIKRFPSILVLDGSYAKLKLNDMNLKIKPVIHKKENKKYISLYINLIYKNLFGKVENIETTVNIDDKKSIYLTTSKSYYTGKIEYLDKNNKMRDLLIEVEVNIL